MLFPALKNCNSLLQGLVRMMSRSGADKHERTRINVLRNRMRARYTPHMSHATHVTLAPSLARKLATADTTVEHTAVAAGVLQPVTRHPRPMTAAAHAHAHTHAHTLARTHTPAVQAQEHVATISAATLSLTHASARVADARDAAKAAADAAAAAVAAVMRAKAELHRCRRSCCIVRHVSHVTRMCHMSPICITCHFYRVCGMCHMAPRHAS